MSIEQMQNRTAQPTREHQDSQPSLIESCCQVTENSIRENPVISTLAAFGIGVGLGAVVGSMLAEPAGGSRRRTAEALGRRVLDSLTDVLPDSVRRHVS